MGNLVSIAAAIGCDFKDSYQDASSWFDKRDEIGTRFSEIIIRKTTKEWLSTLEIAGIWCSPVLNYQEVFEQETVKQAGVVQTLSPRDNIQIRTTRSPITINEAKLYSPKAAPKVGADNELITKEFNLDI